MTGVLWCTINKPTFWYCTSVTVSLSLYHVPSVETQFYQPVFVYYHACMFVCIYIYNLHI